jgi:dolichyl-phosphate beta-glucosyltransferase
MKIWLPSFCSLIVFTLSDFPDVMFSFLLMFQFSLRCTCVNIRPMLLSLVFPVKNQTEKLVRNLVGTGVPFFESLAVPYELIIVDDGSDATNHQLLEKSIKEMPSLKKAILLPYENHSGKGHNVGKGILAAKGDYVLFMDSDFSTDLSVIKQILPMIDTADAFIATRHGKGSRIVKKQSGLRRLISFLSRRVISLFFHFKNITDTQCGFKVFRTSVAKKMVSKQIIDGFAFDVEYLYFLQINHYKIQEIPVVWTNDEDSTISHPFKTCFAFVKDMVKIKKNKKFYRLGD